MNKYVAVTGANGDIGLAICSGLLADGFSILYISQHLDRVKKLDGTIHKNKHKVFPLHCDVSDEKELATTFKIMKSITPYIYGLVNNVGIYPIIRLEQYSLKLWEKVMRTNVTSAFLCTQMVIPFMEKYGGRIVNISSTGAHLGSRDPGYAASKAGLIGLTKSSARNLAKYKIMVNAIAPGTIDTRMSLRMNIEDRKLNVDTTLLRRLGNPEDVSGVVRFLFSSYASYLTGSTIDVNGGLYIR